MEEKEIELIGHIRDLVNGTTDINSAYIKNSESHQFITTETTFNGIVSKNKYQSLTLVAIAYNKTKTNNIELIFQYKNEIKNPEFSVNDIVKIYPSNDRYLFRYINSSLNYAYFDDDIDNIKDEYHFSDEGIQKILDIFKEQDNILTLNINNKSYYFKETLLKKNKINIKFYVSYTEISFLNSFKIIIPNYDQGAIKKLLADLISFDKYYNKFLNKYNKLCNPADINFAYETFTTKKTVFSNLRDGENKYIARNLSNYSKNLSKFLSRDDIIKIPLGSDLKYTNSYIYVTPSFLVKYMSVHENTYYHYESLQINGLNEDYDINKTILDNLYSKLKNLSNDDHDYSDWVLLQELNT